MDNSGVHFDDSAVHEVLHGELCYYYYYLLFSYFNFIALIVIQLIYHTENFVVSSRSNKQRQPPRFYGHYTGHPALAGTSS